jgi:hypothetical protein
MVCPTEIGSVFNFLVLLSITDATWKITDFGLTTQGTSRVAYTYHPIRSRNGMLPCSGVDSRRIGNSHKNSDIWALAHCIFYELSNLKRFRTSGQSSSMLVKNGDWNWRIYKRVKQRAGRGIRAMAMLVNHPCLCFPVPFTLSSTWFFQHM